MKKVISIKNIFGQEIDLNKLDIQFIGKDFVIANYKGFGFTTNYSAANGYTVVIANH